MENVFSVKPKRFGDINDSSEDKITLGAHWNTQATALTLKQIPKGERSGFGLHTISAVPMGFAETSLP